MVIVCVIYLHTIVRVVLVFRLWRVLRMMPLSWVGGVDVVSPRGSAVAVLKKWC